MVEKAEELEADEIEGFAGAVFQFGSSGFFGRVEAATDGDNESFSAGVTYAIGGRR